MIRRRPPGGLALLVTALLALATGCAGDPAGDPDSSSGRPAPSPGVDSTGDEVTSPLAGCSGLTAPPPDAPAPAGNADAGARPALPELTLPCFTGGEPFSLADLRGPAVVNLWASWCPPCREELPELQRFADQHAGQVHVLGVITQDPRRAAPASLAEALGISFPALDDRDGELLSQVDAISLPVTLFVDETGHLAYLYPAPLDAAALADLAAEHLGVAEHSGAGR